VNFFALDVRPIYGFAVIRQLKARLAREGKPFATFRYSSGSVLRKRGRIDALRYRTFSQCGRYFAIGPVVVLRWRMRRPPF
jgi:hypothetical protein